MENQGLVTERIRRQPCNRKIAGSIPVYGRFATSFSKEFNLTMQTMVPLATIASCLGQNHLISKLNMLRLRSLLKNTKILLLLLVISKALLLVSTARDA